MCDVRGSGESGGKAGAGAIDKHLCLRLVSFHSVSQRPRTPELHDRQFSRSVSPDRMSEARDYLLAIDNDKAAAAQIAEETAQSSHTIPFHTPLLILSAGLQTKTITLIGVVQSLGEWINDEDPKVRGKSVSYLTAVLAALPPKYLSRQQIQVLCHFFCDRIQDGGAIEGLISLSGLQRLNNEMVQITGRA